MIFDLLYSRRFKVADRFPMNPGKISLSRLITQLLGPRTRMTIDQQDTRLLCHKDCRAQEGQPVAEGGQGQEGRRV